MARTDTFVGREGEIERLLRHGKSEDSKGLALLVAPSAGASELLRHVYDRLFIDQEQVVPIYFELNVSDGTARNAALRFLREFLTQTVAFRRRDAGIIAASPEFREISELAAPADGYWIDRLIEAAAGGETEWADQPSYVRSCLSSPLRAAASGLRPFVMIDNLHIAATFAEGGTLLSEIEDVFSAASIPYVFAGPRRFLFGRSTITAINLEQLSIDQAGKLVENLSTVTAVAINDQTRDLIAVQLSCNAKNIKSLFAAAATAAQDLDSFERVERIYADEIFGGRIGKSIDATFDRIVPAAEVQYRVLELLAASMQARGGKLSVDYWKVKGGDGTGTFDTILRALHDEEIINVSSGSVVIDPDNVVLGDYIQSRTRLEISGEPRALVVGESLSEYIKRAPRLMARTYRRRAAIGLRELMPAFDGRQISSALIDYRRFKAEFKGAEDEKILTGAMEDTTRLTLPRIIYTAHTSAFYPRLSELCDTERSAVAIGFTGAGEKVEVVWIAAEIDSKLEATQEVTEFWCDRLEMVALNSNFSNYIIWLIAPEGFSPAALEILRDRNAYGSSQKQAELMAEMLGTKSYSEIESPSNEYEIVVPMGPETEMIAAHTIEDIAKRHNFPAKAINQIKTAVVEACINAGEHSLSPDQRLYQKFAIDADKITITVSNRGLRVADKPIQSDASEEARRGWGLKIIRGLMDEVNFEPTDDGTRITMVKYLKAA